MRFSKSQSNGNLIGVPVYGVYMLTANKWKYRYNKCTTAAIANLIQGTENR